MAAITFDDKLARTSGATVTMHAELDETESILADIDSEIHSTKLYCDLVQNDVDAHGAFRSMAEDDCQNAKLALQAIRKPVRRLVKEASNHMEEFKLAERSANTVMQVDKADVELVGQAIDVLYRALLTKNIDVQRVLEAKQRRLSELHQNWLTVRQRRTEITKRAETAKTKRYQLSTTLEEVQNRAVVLKEDLSRRQCQKRELQQEVRTANGRIEQLDTAKRTVADQLSAAQYRLQNGTSDVQAIRRKISAIHAQAENLRSELASTAARKGEILLREQEDRRKLLCDTTVPDSLLMSQDATDEHRRKRESLEQDLYKIRALVEEKRNELAQIEGRKIKSLVDGHARLAEQLRTVSERQSQASQEVERAVQKLDELYSPREDRPNIDPVEAARHHQEALRRAEELEKLVIERLSHLSPTLVL